MPGGVSHFGAEPLRLLKTISFCKKIVNLTLSYLCRKYTTNSPFVAQSKAVLNVSGDKLPGGTSQGKLPAAVCGWAVGVCWHITLLPMFWGCETRGGDPLLYLLCVTLVCVGFHPTPHPRSTPPSFSFAFFRERDLPSYDCFWCLLWCGRIIFLKRLHQHWE